MRVTGLIVLLAALLATGCTTMTKNMSQEPVDQDHGSRTFGAFIEDGNIERKVKINLARASADLDESHIVVVSFNGNVLLAGQVASESLKTQAENIAREVRHVYLMGLLTREEADMAVQKVQKVGGVQKIVKIIEYID